MKCVSDVIHITGGQMNTSLIIWLTLAMLFKEFPAERLKLSLNVSPHSDLPALPHPPANSSFPLQSKNYGQLAVREQTAGCLPCLGSLQAGRRCTTTGGFPSVHEAWTQTDTHRWTFVTTLQILTYLLYIFSLTFGCNPTVSVYLSSIITHINEQS